MKTKNIAFYVLWVSQQKKDGKKMISEKEKNQSQKISKIYHLTLKDKDFRKLERCLHEYILCKEILEYTDTKKIGIWQVYKKIRKKLDPDWAEHLIDE